MEEFMDPKVRSKNYPLISNIPQLILLLQKYKEESHGFFSSKDEKQKQINLVIILIYLKILPDLKYGL